MSELSVKVAREHAWTLVDMVDRGGYLYTVGKCACGAEVDGDDQDTAEYSAHLAEVTEAAVRETIAAALHDLPTSRTAGWLKAWDSISLNEALDIARGET